MSRKQEKTTFRDILKLARLGDQAKQVALMQGSEIRGLLILSRIPLRSIRATTVEEVCEAA